jgi:hypothetical protein
MRPGRSSHAQTNDRECRFRSRHPGPALAEIAELQARIMRVNAMARAGVGTAHGTLEHLAAAVTGLVETRGSIVACHAALVDAKGKVPGLRTVSFGDGSECPPEEGANHLRIVA